jgi:hypothetical protein
MIGPSLETSDNPIRAEGELPPGFINVNYTMTHPGVARAVAASLAFYIKAHRAESTEAAKYTATAANIAAVLDLASPVDGNSKGWFSEVTFAHRLQEQGTVDKLPDGWEDEIIEGLPPALADAAGLNGNEPSQPAATYHTRSEWPPERDISFAGPPS